MANQTAWPASKTLMRMDWTSSTITTIKDMCLWLVWDVSMRTRNKGRSLSLERSVSCEKPKVIVASIPILLI
jgi:hypothetical protein